MPLEINELCKAYNDRAVLNRLSFQGNNGIFVISGVSGCGKTTLLRILSGLEKADSGSFSYDGKLSVLFQEPRLFPWLTSVENICKATCCTKEYALSILDELGLGDEADKLPHELSGGMQRRVAIGRALCSDAKLYLLDEPLSGLDDTLKDDVCKIIAKHIDPNSVALIISHELTHLRKIADRMLVMDNGKLISVDR